VIAIIKYSKENIAKYWDDSNYRFFVLKLNANQELIVYPAIKPTIASIIAMIPLEKVYMNL
jgi:hypothetical protein